MKATVNGVTLEGTPEEIHQYLSLVKEESKKEYFNKSKGIPPFNLQKVIKDVEDITGKKPIIFGYPDVSF